MTRAVTRDMTKQHLVVIGNGMAGARAVEEILARGGGDQFRITMFGDEPYGNYNRIMLCHVLAGEDSDARSSSTRCDWYAENDITLHAGVRVVRVDRFAKKVYGNDGTIESVRQADHRHREPHLLPADGRHVGRRQDAHPRRLRVPHARRHPRDARLRRANARTAVVIGGGLLGLEAALRAACSTGSRWTSCSPGRS